MFTDCAICKNMYTVDFDLINTNRTNLRHHLAQSITDDGDEFFPIELLNQIAERPIKREPVYLLILFNLDHILNPSAKNKRKKMRNDDDLLFQQI